MALHYWKLCSGGREIFSLSVGLYFKTSVMLLVTGAHATHTISVQPDTSWQLQAKSRVRVAHGRHLQHQFPTGLWQVDNDEITHQKVWKQELYGS
jgi:hypothetical protein